MSRTDECALMDDLTREFLIESQEGLDRMERCLTELEEKPRDKELLAKSSGPSTPSREPRGSSASSGWKKLAHAGENLLGLLRDEKVDATSAVITALLQLLDGLRTILKAIEAEGNEVEGDDSALIVRLDELCAPAKQPETRRESETRRGPFTEIGFCEEFATEIFSTVHSKGCRRAQSLSPHRP